MCKQLRRWGEPYAWPFISQAQALLYVTDGHRSAAVYRGQQGSRAAPTMAELARLSDAEVCTRMDEALGMQAGHTVCRPYCKSVMQSEKVAK